MDQGYLHLSILKTSLALPKSNVKICLELFQTSDKNYLISAC